MLSSSSTRYLLDTNMLIHYVRGDALATHLESLYSLRASQASPIISVVTVGELRSLALQLAWGEAKLRQLQKLLEECVIVPLNLAGIIEAYAELDNYSVKAGRAMGKNDIWIAATAKATGTRLLPTDKDFDHLHPLHIQRDWIDPKAK